ALVEWDALLRRPALRESSPGPEFSQLDPPDSEKHLRCMRLLSSMLILVLFFPSMPVIGAGMKEMNPPKEPEVSREIALIGGRLIDGNGGLPVEDAVVIVRGSKIVAVGNRRNTAIPARAERLDAKGLSILPGLIDTHFHSRHSDTIPIEFELEKGITSFRDPGHPWRYYDTALNSKLTLPRIFLCGGHLDGPPAVHADQAVVPTTAEETRQAVFSHVDRGASAIKVYFRLHPELIVAACEAAKERGVLVTAHLELVDADQAIQAGVRGIEHVTSFGTVLADPADADHFKAEIYRESNARRPLRPWLWSRIDLDNSFRLEPLLDLIVQTGTFVSPTIALFEARSGQKDATEEQVQGFKTMMDFIARCHKSGAKLVVGSHTSVPFAEHGYAYQREMDLLVEAGMTPLEVLTSATKTGAEFFGIEDRLGTVEVGKTADLVLVEGDPTQDIGVMRNVRHVMLNGSLIQ
ncbi:MAG: amidohydrolase family protein, partial [Verrucomicrobiae bacterium]|nr:amidohydrolase family protein [Verrucomicrobiae bacterium]